MIMGFWLQELMPVNYLPERQAVRCICGLKNHLTGATTLLTLPQVLIKVINV